MLFWFVYESIERGKMGPTQLMLKTRSKIIFSDFHRHFSTEVAQMHPDKPKQSMATPRRFIIGLGNPGEEYSLTRHNVGFLVLQHFAKRFLPHICKEGFAQFRMSNQLCSMWLHSKIYFSPKNDQLPLLYDMWDCMSERRRNQTTSEGVQFPVVDLALLQPQTYMNKSGTAAKKLFDLQNLRIARTPRKSGSGDEILVVYDDLAFVFGECKMNPRGGPGSHNGLSDILRRLGNESIPRLRVGIGELHMPQSMERYVLSKFSHHQRDDLNDVLDMLCEVLRVYVFRGYEAASNVANNITLQEFRSLVKKYALKD